MASSQSSSEREPTRRHFLVVTASGALLTLTPGCDQKSMRAALFVAIIIGERIVTFSPGATGGLPARVRV